MPSTGSDGLILYATRCYRGIQGRKSKKTRRCIRARSFVEGMRQPMLLGLLIMLTRAFTP